MNCIFCGWKMAVDAEYSITNYSCIACRTKYDDQFKYRVGTKMGDIIWEGIYFDRYAIVQNYEEGTGWYGTTTIMAKNIHQGYHNIAVIKPRIEIDLATITEEALEVMAMLA